MFEVLSPSTEVTDRIKKFAYYRECQSLQEYVMVDSQKIAVEIYRREKKKWILETLGLDDTLTLESLNLQLPIKNIYRKIHF